MSPPVACQVAIVLSALALDRRLGIFEAVRLRSHAMFCRDCRAARAQAAELTRFLFDAMNAED